MPRFVFSLLIIIILAGCAAPTVSTSTAGDALPPADDGGETVGESQEDPVELAVVVAEPPDRCAQLLESLELTQPLIDNLNSALGDHASRLERSLARLDQPATAAEPVACAGSGDTDLEGKEIIGGIEWLYMDPPGLHYRARVDSGAETSSLSARDVVEFERDGDDWVRFTFEHDTKEPVELELPISRTVLIRQASAEELDRRVVVEMDIRLGERLQRTEFTLTDRSRMTYPVLLGRAFLMDLYVIDVARSYTHRRYEAP